MILPTLSEDTEEKIEGFLARTLENARAKGYVLGVSGGIDSAVVMRLCVRAVGADKVLALMMPEKDSPREDLADAKELCELDGVRRQTIDISEPVAVFKKVAGFDGDRTALANVKARSRMVVLYHFANTEHLLVVGTSNKSETLMGYFTKFGDGAADLEPIADLYKTQVRLLAKRLGIPDKIIKKAPSAGLWKGQTDEGEMGISYDRLDAILLGMELGLSEKQVAVRTESSESDVHRIQEAIRKTSHKRRCPPTVKIGVRTPGLDWPEGD